MEREASYSIYLDTDMSWPTSKPRLRTLNIGFQRAKKCCELQYVHVNKPEFPKHTVSSWLGVLSVTLSHLSSLE